LVFYIDSDEVELYDKIYEWSMREGKKFRGCLIYVSGNKEPKEVNVAVRRNRIVDMKERSKALITGFYVFGIEDDTLLPTDAFMRLKNNMYKRVGYIEGAEVGRWGLPMVGAWQCDDLNEPTHQETLLPPSESCIEKITGGGFYCYLTLSSLYKGIKYRWHDECFGPDVCYVMDVCKLGYEAYIDWGVSCTHMVGEGTDLTVGLECSRISWKKIDDIWVVQPYINKEGTRQWS